ncbi:hypothetical protein G9X67_34740 [Rhizobium sp. WYCCWR 11152]|uniref:hypothetical protein n=1 Tax=Rhizobium sp. WYCCWR 11152 TaxID=2692316 RepID=UPI001490E5C3|nr:hypothetical protein [Rhizobium sp. WYCCWR 11152]NNU70411.1 hypothetical protein [Rhizobium sp. WYCCWR 11152]
MQHFNVDRPTSAANRGTTKMTEHQEIWCQPADHPKRQFLVMFDDPQMDLAVFDNEEEARAFWEKANLNWTCYLMGTLPRSTSTDGGK